MSVKISGVKKHSAAFRAGLRKDFLLLSINGNSINDVLDYDFHIKEKRLAVSCLDTDGKEKKAFFLKKQEDDIGLEFESYLMDNQQCCKNKCIFCFIDQMPKGMRNTLYFKDDDSRLSFLMGNYITLTNLSDSDVERIIKMHISPVNISVHTMNPELRVKMMKNPNAGKSLEIMKRFADAGIKMNTQLVLCPGINDGKELEFSLGELGKLYPAVQSVAAVPVGLTKFREGLCELTGYTKETAGEVIDIIECFSEHFLYFNKTRLAFAADEFYLKAERPVPEADFYEDFSQLENGVGLWASLKDEFFRALREDGSFTVSEKREISIATGEAAYPLLEELSALAQKKYKGLKINVYKIKNRFFGESITVAGLIVGEDLTNELNGKALGRELLIPSVMLRFEGDMFLDSMTLVEAEKRLGVKITPVATDGYELLDKILGR